MFWSCGIKTAFVRNGYYNQGRLYGVSFLGLLLTHFPSHTFIKQIFSMTPDLSSTSNPEADRSEKSPDNPIRHRRENGKQILVKIGLDMVPVIAGILVALFVSNVQQNILDRKLLASTLQSLSEEFSQNQKVIESLLPNQQRFLDTLRFYMNDKTYSLNDMSIKTNGMGTPQLQSTNWRASLSNNSFRLLNFETIKLLSQIESLYRELEDQEGLMYPNVYGPPWFKTGSEGWEYRKGVDAWMISYMGNLNELVVLYKEFEDVVRNEKYRRS